MISKGKTLKTGSCHESNSSMGVAVSHGQQHQRKRNSRQDERVALPQNYISEINDSYPERKDHHQKKVTKQDDGVALPRNNTSEKNDSYPARKDCHQIKVTKQGDRVAFPSNNTSEIYVSFPARKDYQKKFTKQDDSVSIYPPKTVYRSSKFQDHLIEYHYPPPLRNEYSIKEISVHLKEIVRAVKGPVLSTKQMQYKEECNQEQNPSNVNSIYEFAEASKKTLTKPQPDAKDLEKQMMTSLQEPKDSKKLFCVYLLLDPRREQDHQSRYQEMTPLEIYRTFRSAIFYVGKGKNNRPLSHFKETIKYSKEKETKKDKENTQSKRSVNIKKVQRIEEVWSSGMDVGLFECFLNLTSKEALTLEACMIEDLGLGQLTNAQLGTYYGIAKTWSKAEKKKAGADLLCMACMKYLVKDKRQIRRKKVEQCN